MFIRRGAGARPQGDSCFFVINCQFMFFCVFLCFFAHQQQMQQELLLPLLLLIGALGLLHGSSKASPLVRSVRFHDMLHPSRLRHLFVRTPRKKRSLPHRSFFPRSLTNARS